MSNSIPSRATHDTLHSAPGSTDAAESLLAGALGLREHDTPFPWQERLLQEFLGGEIPRSLDVPTGLGKTATMAVWLVARALGARVPTRMVYVVDRRVVVDQATRVAELLREWVEGQSIVREGLGLEDGKLPVSTLRGQFVDNRDWLEDPARPAIVVGTVDMIGSRLLFEGYRASRRMRPYMAGLLGHDALFVLDEAHLVPPFERLLERIILHAADLESPEALAVKPPPSRLLSLSATGRSRGGEPFDLSEDDFAHSIVQKRLAAEKRLELVDLEANTELAQASAEAAWALAGEGTTPIRCVVFLSKREDAEKAKTHLASVTGVDKLKKGQEPPVEIELLVGGRRVYERARAAARLEELGFLAGNETERGRPHILIATSAGEVGVDLDADHMVCDLVPWERMVQRLGRVNRRGEGRATVRVLCAVPDADERVAGARALLSRLPRHGGAIDASPGALRNLQREARGDAELAREIARASTPEPLYPPLDRATVDAWSMTSLEHHPGRPAIAPWLRGWVEDRPQTSVAWRAHIPLVNGALPSPSFIERFFDAAPIHASEQLEVESSRVAEWLKKRAKKLRSLAEKLEKSGAPDPAARIPFTCAAVIRERGTARSQCLALEELEALQKKSLQRLLAGGEIIVDARFAGLSDGLLDASQDEAPPSLDGEEWALGGVPFRVRITADLAAIESLEWRERERFPLEQSVDGETVRWIVVERSLGDFATEEDRSAGYPQTLAEHQRWTAARARALASRQGLPARAGRLLAIAARLHDEGKRAQRWQRAFHAPAGTEPHAKTLGPVNVALLDGYRHELGSLPLAARDAEVAALDDEERDLVLHLIASHHGYARPTIRTSGCEDAPPSIVEARAREVALRFLRVQSRLGPWGLAWWEALLRAADQQASRENDARTRSSAAREGER